nr:MAG TPA: hypothetical protein [Caudoviricetes sp.]
MLWTRVHKTFTKKLALTSCECNNQRKIAINRYVSGIRKRRLLQIYFNYEN